MFTGIVSQRATVQEIRPAGAAGAARLSVRLDREVETIAVGDSVALDGACLTVVERRGRDLRFDVVPETLRRTTLGALAEGSLVNVETALRLGDPFGGHVVLGHVDGVGVVEAVERVGDDVRMTVRVPPRLHGAAVPKGSIALDGVSLTVGEAGEGWFSVYLVPHTLAVTGLASKRLGDRVNVEADAIGRYVEHHVRRAMTGRLSPAEEGPKEESP
jgi:riboflavin synthase